MPGNYALGCALLKASDHLVEHVAARLLGGFAFDELAGYGETILFSVVAEFSELRLYGKDLPVRLVRGLARIQEIPHIRLFHTLPPLLLRTVLPSRAEPALSAILQLRAAGKAGQAHQRWAGRTGGHKDNNSVRI
ncbi:MAG: hypothetical protein A2016_06935 [Elusimicrobia bacterium GWF2_62_30]|nr:MAG: hypothetical protein A2016_06935 [Elusimicrobia bacterium GWF2_62_30]